MSDAISYRYTDNKPQLRSDKNNKLNGGLKYQLTVKTSNIRTYMFRIIFYQLYRPNISFRDNIDIENHTKEIIRCIPKIPFLKNKTRLFQFI